jgi:hypothetical protein
MSLTLPGSTCRYVGKTVNLQHSTLNWRFLQIKDLVINRELAKMPDIKGFQAIFKRSELITDVNYKPFFRESDHFHLPRTPDYTPYWVATGPLKL